MIRHLFSVLSLVLVGAGASGSGDGRGIPATTIHLLIAGGKHAGTYDAKSNDPTCSYGLAGPASWGNQYSVTGKTPTEFSSLQLIVPDTKDAADGTDKFQLTVGFGDLLKAGYNELTIDTKPDASKKAGSGTVTVQDRGKSGKVTFKGKTEDGVSLEGTIDCGQVLRAEG